MFDFLLPTYVVAKWNSRNKDYSFLCTFNDHCIPLASANKFYFKFSAKLALRKHIQKNGHLLTDLNDYDVIDYRELGYTHEDAGAGYTSGGFVD